MSLELSVQWAQEPRQDERGGPGVAGTADPAGHRGHDGAPHLQGRDLTQVGTHHTSHTLSSDQAWFHESYRDIDNRLLK